MVISSHASWARGAAVAALAAGVLAGALPLASPPPAEAAARTVCTGVARCQVVAHTDVDGDGEADEVGMAADLRHSDAGKGVVTVRVRTAAGETLSTTSRSISWFGADADAWFGAARIDGRRGRELVVGQRMGAHSSSYRVITYRHGELVTLRAPKAPSLTGRADDTTTWYTDAALNFHDGYTRSRTKGVTYVKLTTAERDPSGTSHHGWTARYRWAHGGWRLLSVKRAHYASDAAVQRTAGWHVSGLPVGE